MFLFVRQNVKFHLKVALLSQTDIFQASLPRTTRWNWRNACFMCQVWHYTVTRCQAMGVFSENYRKRVILSTRQCFHDYCVQLDLYTWYTQKFATPDSNIRMLLWQKGILSWIPSCHPPQLCSYNWLSFLFPLPDFNEDDYICENDLKRVIQRLCGEQRLAEDSMKALIEKVCLHIPCVPLCLCCFIHMSKKHPCST